MYNEIDDSKGSSEEIIDDNPYYQGRSKSMQYQS